jgi:hypothetical protein
LKNEILQVILRRNVEKFVGDKLGWKSGAKLWKALDEEGCHPQVNIACYLSDKLIESISPRFFIFIHDKARGRNCVSGNDG